MSLARRSMVSVALLLIATSCSGDDDSVSSTSSSVAPPTTVAPVGVSTNSPPETTTTGGTEHPAAARLDCADPIEAEALPDSVQLIGGAIALQTTRTFSTPLQLGRTVGEGSSALQFAKSGLVVRAGEQVEIVVLPRSGRTALVSWGNTGTNEPAARFMVGPCATGAGWLVFPGGYWVSEPGCVSMVVRHDGIDEYVTVAVGAPCSGPV